ncbi:MAG: prenyltransferase/squalene oxidase repeat-containing protein [Cystobacter sp.]
MRALQQNPEQNRSAENKRLSRAAEIILTDLRALMADLGRDGGLTNASVYDTAMVVRLAPPQEDGGAAAVEWLLSQQLPDGGWDNPKVLRARDTPTLAAVLALHVRGKGERAQQAVQRGLEFLRQQRPFWTTLPDDLLVGVEISLTRLLEDAQALGLDVPVDQYALVIADGKKRQQKLAKLKAHHGTPPAIMWEGWGTEPETAWMDPEGGLGLSPASTAAWVKAAESRPELQEACARARRFLTNAEKGCDVRVPGVVPTTWPIDWMEQQWGLFALLCAGLLDHPLLADVVAPHVDTLAKALSPRGIGFTEHFMPDGDCTAVTVAILKGAHRRVDVAALRQYERGNHFFTYPQESNPSLTTTAHAVMALNLAGVDTSRWVDAMCELSTPDGRWLIDKWQTSWLYTTTHVMFAIPDAKRIRTSIQTLLGHQKENGGWGAGEHATPVETAYAALALLSLKNKGVEEEGIRSALVAANHYLRRAYHPFVPNEEPMWIGKTLYCPYRMDRAFELSAMLALALAED